MLIDYTAQEKKQIDAIYSKYTPDIKALADAMDAEKDKDAKQALFSKLSGLWEQVENELEVFVIKTQRKHFKPIADKGNDAVLAHALGQLDDIINYLYDSATKGQLTNVPDLIGGELDNYYKDFSADKGLEISLAASYVLTELNMHIDALKGNTEALKTLSDAIITSITTSNHVHGKLTTSLEKKIQSIVFGRDPQNRRKSLSNIKTYGLMNDKVNAQLLQDSTNIFQQEADGQLMLRWEVDQSGKNEEQIPVLVGLTYEGEGLRIGKKTTAFDKQVYEAVGTRYHYLRREDPEADLYITPQEIWRTMNGKNASDKNAKPGEKQLKRICDSIRKMQFTSLVMDITEEIKKRHYTFDDARIVKGQISTYLLKCDEVDFTTENGLKLHGFRISEEPILYTYNRIKDRLLFVPYEMLDTSNYVSDSENVAEFKGYLLQQIQLMINAREKGNNGNYFKRSNNILLETIYKDTGILTPEERANDTAFTSDNARNSYIRKTRKADREKIEKILDAWTAKKFIKGYAPITKGNKVTGYSIKF